jgi:hypothetical protein
MTYGVRVLREQTRKFIAEDAVEVVLTRGTRTPDGAGGFTIANPAPLLPQTMKVIQIASAAAVERKSVGGEVVRPDIKLLAEWDADIQMGDTMEWNGLILEVVWMIKLDYEVTAEMGAR